jgi:hypothetical protein
MSVSICLVPLVVEVKLSVVELTKHLVNAWPSLPAVEDLQDNERTSSFTVGIANVILGYIPTGIPWVDREGPCSAAILWPDVTTDLQDHPAHVIVTVSGELDAVAASTLLTQVTASLLVVCDAASGVYWTNAVKLIRRDLFIDFTREILPNGPPLYLWVDYRIARDGETTSAGFTHGMQALGLMELETEQAPEVPSELMQRFVGIGNYLIQNGMVINDGDLIGEDTNERIRVVYSESKFGHSGQVMRLAYENCLPTRPR